MVNICSTLHSGKAAGFVNISASLMKETITSIRSSLTHISNSSLSSGVVLVELKRLSLLFPPGQFCVKNNFA